MQLWLYRPGELCDERVEILDQNKVLGILMPLRLGVLAAAGLFLVWRHKFKGGEKDWQMSGDRCVRLMSQSISPMVLLVYGVVCALIGIGFLLLVVIESKGGALVALTVWNWVILTGYFCTINVVQVLTPMLILDLNSHHIYADVMHAAFLMEGTCILSSIP